MRFAADLQVCLIVERVFLQGQQEATIFLATGTADLFHLICKRIAKPTRDSASFQGRCVFHQQF